MEQSSRHSEKSLRAPLSRSEIEELYAALRYYGQVTIHDIVFNMMHRDETPLENFWISEIAFFTDYYPLRNVARQIDLDAFMVLLEQRRLPAGVALSERDRSFLLTNPPRLLRSSRCLLHFFASIPAFFAYEVELIALGYPCDPAA